MSRDEIREEVQRILLRLVPGADFSRVEGDASLRRTLAADSMDVLNFVTALQEELGVDVPERDYQQLDTLEGCVDYLVRAIGEGKAGGTHVSLD
jgi:acyl carrier protein